MTHRCHVRGCPFATRALPWHRLLYVCPFHRLDDEAAVFRPFTLTHR